jgi:hypothetical protein
MVRHGDPAPDRDFPGKACFPKKKMQPEPQLETAGRQSGIMAGAALAQACACRFA